MGKLLRSSADDRLKQRRRELTLQLFLRSGPFWEGVQDFRTRWGIASITHVATKSDQIPFPPVCAEPPSLPNESDRTEPYDWTQAAHCWEEDVTLLMIRVIPDFFRIPGDRFRSLRLWFPFLSACVRYDPPEMDLLAFADQCLPIPETFFEATSSLPVVDNENTEARFSMVAPPITLADPDRSDARHRLHEEMLISELQRRLEPIGIDLKALVQEVRSDPSYLEKLVSHPLEPNPLKAFIVVTPETTDEDVSHARKLIHDGFGTVLDVGRRKIDELTAVQVAIFRRHGKSVPQIANHFGWPLSPDDHGKARRSDKVLGHIKRGEEILRERKNSRN